MAILVGDKINLCKYCKLELRDDEVATKEMNLNGYFYVCSERQAAPIQSHKPMDNLDYIEWLAKKRNIV